MKKMLSALAAALSIVLALTTAFASDYDVENMTPDEMKEAIIALESEKAELEEQVKDLKVKLFDLSQGSGEEDADENVQKTADGPDEIDLSFKLEDGTELLNNDNVDSASVLKRMNTATGENEYMVEVTLDERGKDIFGKATTEHLGERIIIAIDGETVSAPIVREPVTDGKVIISGNFTQETAEELAEYLNQ